MFTKLTLRSKLILGFLGVAFFLVPVGLVGFIGLRNTGELYRHVTSVNMPNSIYVLEMKGAETQYLLELLQLAGDGNSAEDIAKIEKNMANALDKFQDLDKKYNEVPFTEGEKEIYDKLIASWGALKDEVKKVVPLAKSSKAGDKVAFDAAFRGFDSTRKSFANDVEALLKYHKDHADSSVAAAEKSAEQSGIVSLISIVLGFSLAGAIGFFISRSLAEKLRAVAGSLASGATQVAVAAKQVSASSTQLSASVTEQAAAIEETSASVEELSSMVNRNAENARQAGDLSQKGRDAAERGDQEISRLITAMADMSTSSKKIEEIINVIDDIAFQTNLLALNAAVEAARAGEQGKGFAVVAEAVRNLAQRSAAAAKDITALIQESVQKTQDGGKVADRGGVALKEIVSGVNKVAGINHEIATASQEQSKGIQQISMAMQQMSESTQANSGSAGEAAAASSELSAQADVMQKLVQDLTAIVEGNALAGHHSHHTSMTSAVSAREPVGAEKLENMLPMAPYRVAKQKTVAKAGSTSAALSANSANSANSDEPVFKTGTTDGF